VAELLSRLDALERRLAGGEGGAGPAGGGVGRGGEPAARRRAPTPEPAPERAQDAAEAAAPGADASPSAVFDRLRVFAQRENRGLFAALEGGRASHWDGERLRLELPAGIGARRLASRRADLEAVCERFFGRTVRLELAIPDEPGAAGEAREASQEAGAARRREALDHPAVNAALEILDGEILEIRPLGGPT
jgi:hypothetical protein